VVCTADPAAPGGYLFRAGIYIAAHTAVALLLIGAITLVSDWLHSRGDPLFFDWIPVRYFFEVMDIAILGVFITYGTIEAVRAFRD
jgi:hypothetical protein